MCSRTFSVTGKFQKFHQESQRGSLRTRPNRTRRTRQHTSSLCFGVTGRFNQQWEFNVFFTREVSLITAANSQITLLHISCKLRFTLSRDSGSGSGSLSPLCYFTFMKYSAYIRYILLPEYDCWILCDLITLKSQCVFVAWCLTSNWTGPDEQVFHHHPDSTCRSCLHQSAPPAELWWSLLCHHRSHTHICCSTWNIHTGEFTLRSDFHHSQAVTCSCDVFTSVVWSKTQTTEKLWGSTVGMSLHW